MDGQEADLNGVDEHEVPMVNAPYFLAGSQIQLRKYCARSIHSRADNTGK
jgi:hypothetical protein